jgi:hypothetical protein
LRMRGEMIYILTFTLLLGVIPLQVQSSAFTLKAVTYFCLQSRFPKTFSLFGSKFT